MQEIQTVVIVDDHAILREGLKTLLNASGGLKVIGEADRAPDALRCIQAKIPDIAIVDINLPDMEGLSVIKESARQIPEVKLLVLTRYHEEGYAQLAFKYGARGYCLKTAKQKELLLAIRTVLSGRVYVSPEIAGSILEGVLDDNGRVKIRSPYGTLLRMERKFLSITARNKI